METSFYPGFFSGLVGFTLGVLLSKIFASRNAQLNTENWLMIQIVITVSSVLVSLLLPLWIVLPEQFLVLAPVFKLPFGFACGCLIYMIIHLVNRPNFAPPEDNSEDSE